MGNIGRVLYVHHLPLVRMLVNLLATKTDLGWRLHMNRFRRTRAVTDVSRKRSVQRWGGEG
jgi:hypothetical protein